MSSIPARLILSLLALPLLCGLQATRPESRFGERGREIVSTLRHHFYDPDRAEAWAMEHADYANTATDADSFKRLTREALAELKVSHLAYLTDEDVEYWAMLAIFGPSLDVRSVRYESIGVDVTPAGFLRVVFAGSPAQRAGLRRGDRILLADGRPFHTMRSFRGKAGREVVLSVQRAADEPPFDLTVIPRRIDPAREWLAHQTEGTRILDCDGKRIAYVPMFCGAGPEFERALRHALRSTLNRADALVLDFRYGWGGNNPSFVTLFDPAVPAITNIDRQGQPHVVGGGWNKPLYILTGPGTRSGKELVAHALRRHGRATLVGEPTAGAVLGGRAFPIADDALLIVPVADVLIDDERLEGRPLRPDVEVRDAIEFAVGADPVLDAAIQLAVAAK